MLIKIRRSYDLKEADITPEALYLNRRRLIGTLGAATVAGLAGTGQLGLAASGKSFERSEDGYFTTLQSDRPQLPEQQVNKAFDIPGETLNSYKAITSYNNFYEFGVDKRAPSRYADDLTTDPWSIAVTGAVEQPRTYAFEDLVPLGQAEQRIYRLRCVETWSMVIPWVGVPLKTVLDRVRPLSSAKYVQFQTLYRPDEMRGQRTGVLDWPYQEALRIDEAAHPLAFLAVGLYGRLLPNQNGAPVRLAVPWKYGFKSIKSIVALHFTETRPKTTWNENAPEEYGFFANVNPKVAHPRWSQAEERRIGEFRKRPTEMLNGYAEAVGSLYAGMDMAENY